MMGDNFLSEYRFTAAVEALPLVSIDLCLTNSAHQLLMGRRSNAPAQGYWFTLGGRVRKGESQCDTFMRLMKQEAAIDSVDFCRARLMGIWDHFYEDSRFSTTTRTHYVNIPYWVALADDEAAAVMAGDQHGAWQWFDCSTDQAVEKVHPYAQAYIDWIGRSAIIDPLEHDLI